MLRAATLGRALACFVVPLIDRLGSTVERRLLAVCLPPDASIDDARQFAVSRFRPRARRLSALRRAEAGAAAARERAIHEAFVTTRASGDVQPGLFDGRAMRAREQHSGQLAALDLLLLDELQRLDAESDVQVGSPSLALVVRPEAAR